MIQIHENNLVRLVPESTRVADLIRSGKRLIWRQPAARRTPNDKAMSVKEARLQLWKVSS